MKLTFLGTGTSTGIPQIGCNCEVCRSSDPRDRRLRTSALVETASGKRLLIDCGPDFRQQILRAGSPALDALLVTHTHYDHVGGIDDLRPYCHPISFPVYCMPDVAADLKARIPYCFVSNPYPGVPTFDIHEIDPERSFNVDGIEITPLPVLHARLPIIGFRIANLAYITDCLTMPDSTIEKIRGVDTLVINALRRKPHMSHMTLGQALDIINEARPRQSFLIHLSHDMGLHAQTARLLPEGVEIAVDGQTLTIAD